MGGRWGGLWLSLGLLFAFGTASASAQRADADKMSEARALFMAGRVAFDEGRYEAALKHFEASYEQEQRPALLYNIGQCFDRMRRDEEAIRAFERYLAVETDPDRRASVEARMGALRAAVAARKPAPVAQEPTLPPPPEPVVLKVAPTASEPVVLKKSEPHVRWWLRTPAIVVGAGVLLGVTGGVLMALGSAHGHDVEHAKLGSSYATLHSDMNSANHQWVAGQVLLGVGAAAVAGGVTWLLLERRERQNDVSLSITPTRMQLGGHF